MAIVFEIFAIQLEERTLTCKTVSNGIWICINSKSILWTVCATLCITSVNSLYSLLQDTPVVSAVPISITSSANHILIFCWGTTPTPILRQYGFGGLGTGWHITCLGQTVTMTDSGMNRTMITSPRNFTRRSGTGELSLFWNYQTCSCWGHLCHHFSEPTMMNTANTKQSQTREVIVKRFQMTLFKHLDPSGPDLPTPAFISYVSQ